MKLDCFRSKNISLARIALMLSSLVVLAGCSKSAKDTDKLSIPANPKQAASQLQQVFVAAPPEIKNQADAASEALRTANYEQAIESLQTMKARGNLTFEQGVAVHNSMIALEAKLISAVDSGDANAKRAYELLKKSRRD